MFKRKAEDSGKSTVTSFAFKIFFLHILNVPIMLVLLALMSNLNSLGLNISGNFINIIVTAICFLFYIICLYIEAWRTGERDYNLVLYDRIEYNKLKPLLAALISQIPGFILALLMQFPVAGAQKFARYFYLNFIYPIIVLDAEPYYLSAIYFLPILFAIVPAILGYFLGYRGIRLLDMLIFVKDRDKKRRDLR